MSYQDNLAHTHFIFKSNRDVKTFLGAKTTECPNYKLRKARKTVMGKVDLRLGTESIQLCPIDRDREENQKLTGRGRNMQIGLWIGSSLINFPGKRVYNIMNKEYSHYRFCRDS